MRMGDRGATWRLFLAYFLVSPSSTAFRTSSNRQVPACGNERGVRGLLDPVVLYVIQLAKYNFLNMDDEIQSAPYVVRKGQNGCFLNAHNDHPTMRRIVDRNHMQITQKVSRWKSYYNVNICTVRAEFSPAPIAGCCSIYPVL